MKRLLLIAIFLFFYSNNCLANSDERFINKNRAVLDKKTDLMWNNCMFDSYGITSEDIIPKYILKNKLSDSCYRSGHKDWRLPSIDEVRTISATSGHRYNIIYGDLVYRIYPNTTICTNNVINNYLVQLYLPFSDTSVVGNIYDGHDLKGSASHNRKILLVRGKAKEYFDAASVGGYIINSQIPLGKNEKFGKSTFYGPYILPIGEKYKYFNFCPNDAFRFLKMSEDDIRKLKIEDVVNNKMSIRISDGATWGVQKVNLWNIQDFYDYYLKIKKLSKFEAMAKKDEILEKLLAINKEYKKEYEEILSTTFLIMPIPYEYEFTDKDYDIDKQILLLSIKKRDESCYFGEWGSEINKSILRNKIELPLPLKDAEQIFTNNDKLHYVSNIYIKPIPEQGHEFERYNFKYILFNLTGNESKNLATYVLNIKYEKDKLIYRNPTWGIQYIKHF